MTDTARLILAVMLGACFTCSAEPAASPTNKAVVICFNGKMDSGSFCSSTCFQPDGTLHPTGKMTCGFLGKVSEIEWRFLRRKGNADVYAFTRRFPANKPESKTEHQTVVFSGDKAIVFEDTFQVIVIQGPKAKEKAEQPGA
jgi:hypothetical protein